MSSAFVHRFIIIIGERAMQSVCKAQPSPEASITDSVSFGDRTHRPSRRCSCCRVRAAMSTSPTTQSSGYRGRRKTYSILSSPIDGLQFLLMLGGTPSELRQIVCDVEPRGLRTHPEMGKRPPTGVVVEDAQPEAQHVWGVWTSAIDR